MVDTPWLLLALVVVLVPMPVPVPVPVLVLVLLPVLVLVLLLVLVPVLVLLPVFLVSVWEVGWLEDPLLVPVGGEALPDDEGTVGAPLDTLVKVVVEVFEPDDWCGGLPELREVPGAWLSLGFGPVDDGCTASALVTPEVEGPGP